jgi:hypothetical protein
MRDFQRQFGSEEACQDYLATCRWPDGFVRRRPIGDPLQQRDDVAPLDLRRLHMTQLAEFERDVALVDLPGPLPWLRVVLDKLIRELTERLSTPQFNFRRAWIHTPRDIVSRGLGAISHIGERQIRVAANRVAPRSAVNPIEIVRGRGTWRCRDGIARLDTRERNRCVACNGDGVIPEKRLRALVLAGVRAIAAGR